MYKQSIAIGDDLFAQPYYNLGNIYSHQDKPEEAEKMYVKAIQVDPSFHFAYKNLAVLYAKYGFYSQAVNVLREFKKIRPDDPDIDEAIKRLTEDIQSN